jgi:glycosyltransferase involved in cell wall biosynthesis
MRVLLLSLWYPNDENPILGTFVHEQADALRRLGVDIRVVQPIPKAPFPITLLKESYRRLARIPSTECYQGFDVVHPRYLTLPRHILFERVGDWLYDAVRDAVRSMARNWPFDIIHAHTTYPCGYAANLLRDRDFPSVKVVHTIHRTCIIDAPSYNLQCREKVRTSLASADRDVFVSLEGQHLARDIAGDVIKPKSAYITNGVNTAKFDLDSADRAEIAQMKTEYADTWNLVFVGYLNERKGIKELLPAIKRIASGGHRKLRLFLVGRNDLGTYVDNFLRSEGIADMVSMVGPVLHDRVKIWMNFADAFILPSHSEGLPTVLFEALYARAPSIFTRVGGVGDIVTDGNEALLIPPRSVEAIEQAIGRLIDDPASSRAMAERGHKLIRDNFTWAINATRHFQLYASMLSGSSTVSP